jgi:hypothetical protein
MGFKARGKSKPTCEVKLTRSDGYSSSMTGLSYEAGLAIATIMNRVGEGRAVKVIWKDKGGGIGTVTVPGAKK